ncbi:MAG: ABC transporter permease subunit [Lachnospiraceae bacterium]|nr:ABC transporter permease subunit [Lachnospiraceae bacterium]
MVLLKHELKRGRKSLLIWTLAISAFLVICVFLFPEMKGMMGDVGDIFAEMGSFTKAFGMDQLDFGTFQGYYGIECGNVLGIGGALFAALTGIFALAKEEGNHTAEFLFAHPITRSRAVAEKALAVFLQILICNAVVLVLSLASIAAIGETIFWKELLLLHLAFLLLQLEIAGICFGISACLHRNNAGIGLGLALVFYCLNLMANISESAKALKYVTPFSYAEAADIMRDGALQPRYLAPGMCFLCVGVLAAFLVYRKKDLR